MKMCVLIWKHSLKTLRINGHHTVLMCLGFLTESLHTRPGLIAPRTTRSGNQYLEKVKVAKGNYSVILTKN